MMSGAFSLVNVLADSVGPGTVGFNGEPQDFFMISSLLCMAMILLHTFWGVIAFDAWDQRKWLNLVYVWASHLTVSCLVSTHRLIPTLFRIHSIHCLGRFFILLIILHYYKLIAACTEFLKI